MRVSIAVDSEDVEILRKLLKNYKTAIAGIEEGDFSSSETPPTFVDNLFEDEKDRIDRLLKKLDIVPPTTGVS